jgi:hypothetical protein
LRASLYAICQEATGIMHAMAASVDLSQLAVNADGELHKKMAPEVRGHGW